MFSRNQSAGFTVLTLVAEPVLMQKKKLSPKKFFLQKFQFFRSPHTNFLQGKIMKKTVLQVICVVRISIFDFR